MKSPPTAIMNVDLAGARMTPVGVLSGRPGESFLGRYSLKDDG